MDFTNFTIWARRPGQPWTVVDGADTRPLVDRMADDFRGFSERRKLGYEVTVRATALGVPPDTLEATDDPIAVAGELEDDA